MGLDSIVTYAIIILPLKETTRAICWLLPRELPEPAIFVKP